MERNVGSHDRFARIGIGILALLVGAAGFAGIVPTGELLAVAFVVVGLVATVTGAVQRCVLYEVFGVSTTGQ